MRRDTTATPTINGSMRCSTWNDRSGRDSDVNELGKNSNFRPHGSRSSSLVAADALKSNRSREKFVRTEEHLEADADAPVRDAFLGEFLAWKGAAQAGFQH